DRVEDRPVKVSGPTLAGRDAPDERRAVVNHLTGVERPFPAGESLDHESCVLVDEYAHEIRIRFGFGWCLPRWSGVRIPPAFAAQEYPARADVAVARGACATRRSSVRRISRASPPCIRGCPCPPGAQPPVPASRRIPGEP